jgi:hypothetical protein
MDEPGNGIEANSVAIGPDNGQVIGSAEQGLADGNADALQAEIESQDRALCGTRDRVGGL